MSCTVAVMPSWVPAAGTGDGDGRIGDLLGGGRGEVAVQAAPFVAAPGTVSVTATRLSPASPAAARRTTARPASVDGSTCRLVGVASAREHRDQPQPVRPSRRPAARAARRPAGPARPCRWSAGRCASCSSSRGVTDERDRQPVAVPVRVSTAPAGTGMPAAGVGGARAGPT